MEKNFSLFIASLCIVAVIFIYLTIQSYKPIKYVNCLDNWLAWEIENWEIIYEKWDRLVVSWVREEFWVWNDSTPYNSYYTWKKATRVDFCEYVDPTNKQMIKDATEYYNQQMWIVL